MSDCCEPNSISASAGPLVAMCGGCLDEPTDRDGTIEVSGISLNGEMVKYAGKFPAGAKLTKMDFSRKDGPIVQIVTKDGAYKIVELAMERTGEAAPSVSDQL